MLDKLIKGQITKPYKSHKKETHLYSLNPSTEISKNNEKYITLGFLSSWSTSVEVSVLGLASAIVDSPQFSKWELDTDAGCGCCPLCGSFKGPILAAREAMSEGCVCN